MRDLHDGARTTGVRLSQKQANGRTGARCEYVDIILGGECRNRGEERYEGMLLCRLHAMLLGLEYRMRALLISLSVLDHWLEDNAGTLKDELRVQRIRHLRGEVMEEIDATDLQLEAVREDLE